jgi:hypothetical protein
MSSILDLAINNAFPTSTGLSNANSAYQSYQAQTVSSGPSIPNIPYNPTASQPGASTGPQNTESNALPNGNRFAHLAHLPTFSLYGASDEYARTQRQLRRDQNFASLAPEPETKDKMIMKGMQLATGVNIDSKRKIENDIKKLGIASHDYTLKADARRCRITRWAVSPSSPACSWFVDIVELRSSNERGAKGANMNYVKTSGKEAVVVCGKTMKLKAGKAGRKKWCFEDIEAAAVKRKDGVEVQMEIVAREIRLCTPVEGTAVAFRFRDEWFVPSVNVS